MAHSCPSMGRARPSLAGLHEHDAKNRPPQEWGGGTWDADKGWEFLKANVNMPEAFIRFEWNRYLGWPGQAPSYKVGERIWLQARDDARARKGAGFDLKAFHRDALNLGALGLDPLRKALDRL